VLTILIKTKLWTKLWIEIISTVFSDHHYKVLISKIKICKAKQSKILIKTFDEKLWKRSVFTTMKGWRLWWLISGRGFYICRKPGKGVLTITAVCSKLIFRKVKTQLSHRSSQESNCKMYLFKFQNVFVKLQNVFVQISKSICQNCKMYLFKFQKVFVTNSTLLPLLLLRPEKLNIAIAIAIKNWILPLLLCPEKLNMAIAIAASWKMHLT